MEYRWPHFVGLFGDAFKYEESIVGFVSGRVRFHRINGGLADLSGTAS
jgi:hypothetical protein